MQSDFSVSSLRTRAKSRSRASYCTIFGVWPPISGLPVVHLTFCFQPIATPSQVTDAVQKITASYNCTPLEGMLSYQLKRYQTEADTDKQIILNPSENQKKDFKQVRRTGFLGSAQLSGFSDTFFSLALLGD